MKTLLALLLFPLSALAQTFSTPTYNASDYFGVGGMTWAVPSATINAQQFRYTLNGKKMDLFMQLENTVVGGTPSAQLAFKIPGGYTAAGYITQPVCYAWYIDPNTTSWAYTLAVAKTAYTGPNIGINRMDGANWDVWYGNPVLYLYCGPITLEVQ